MDKIPEHRAGVTARSGDTHVIGKDGKAVNVDEQARAKAATEAKKPSPKKPQLGGKAAPGSSDIAERGE